MIARGATSREDSCRASCPGTTDVTLGVADTAVSSGRQKAKVIMADPVPSQRSQNSCAAAHEEQIDLKAFPGTRSLLESGAADSRGFCVVSTRVALRARQAEALFCGAPTRTGWACSVHLELGFWMLCIVTEHRYQVLSLLRKQPSATVFHLGPDDSCLRSSRILVVRTQLSTLLHRSLPSDYKACKLGGFRR